MERCLHCNRELSRWTRKGLCRTCWEDRDIREGYPSQVNQWGGDRQDMGEMTMEEVEALVRSRMECLPSWWASEVRRQRAKAGRVRWVVPRVKLISIRKGGPHGSN